MSEQLKRVTIYTDGACAGNPGRGGWAAVLESDGAQKVLSGHVPHTTNNAAEFMALVMAVVALRRTVEIQWVTDSLVAYRWWIKARAGKWDTLPTMVSQSLAYQLMEEQKKRGHKWLKVKVVKGHTGVPMNEYVNMVAQREAGTWKKI